MAELVLDGLEKRFGKTLAVDRLSLSVHEGELVTLLGPSGSGKTSVLRLVAGFLAPDQGRILVDGREIQGLPPEKRDIGMVFQSYALFPHRSVERNVAFGLERRDVPRNERVRRVRDALAMVRLEDLGERFPRELSGGQQQRVALARALVIEPTLLLLDEPLSSLDRRLREELREEIRRLQQQLSITTLLVTHDQEEALSVSDRIALINRGRIEQIGRPSDLYDRPTNRFVAESLGKVNILSASLVSPGDGQLAEYRLADGNVIRAAAHGGIGDRAVLAVRPEAIRLDRIDDRESNEAANQLTAVVQSRRFLGPVEEVTVALADGTSMLVRRSDVRGRERSTLEDGQSVDLFWSPERTWRIPE
jgi:putative spermidine/putrescine transport system ATP-binding protein